jgi:adenine-specific DNA glycosylase
MHAVCLCICYPHYGETMTLLQRTIQYPPSGPTEMLEGAIFVSWLVAWYQAHKRNLPWRHTHDPYKIWLSEIILQQTRVAQGLPYYQRFIEKYPVIEDLAHAEEEEVLRLWQGLGYYSRARNLHICARVVVNELGGKFPGTYKELLQLKGVGKYTAGAIASTAFKESVPVVDGNVYRVLARVFGVGEDISSTQGAKVFMHLRNPWCLKKTLICIIKRLWSLEPYIVPQLIQNVHLAFLKRTAWHSTPIGSICCR